MLNLVRAYVRTVTAVNKFLFIIAAALMAIVVPVMMFEVISRYVFHAPTVWGMELAVLLFGPYFLLGGPYVLHLGGHVNMDLFRSRMSPRTGRAVDIFNQLVILFFCAVLLYYAVPLAMQAMAYRETTFSAWNPPLWPYKFAVPASLLLLGLQSLAELAVLCLDGQKEPA
ncbi:TRAP transporter small permease subunit [Castellaniella sp. S9]|uniref:TRAP transporter small permease subunit n=1 Tax=Castellaniella sp. S9 TaxID=2993652 RepID=UPI0022B5A098|nr:TRAP transporter small permease [Castellaniella sp. S9]